MNRTWRKHEHGWTWTSSRTWTWIRILGMDIHVVQLCGWRDIVCRFEVIELNCLQDSIVEQGSNIDSASKSNPVKRSSHNVQPDHLTKSNDQTIIGRLLLRSFAYLWLYFVWLWIVSVPGCGGSVAGVVVSALMPRALSTGPPMT
jgi:hypothetical protein